MVAQTQPPKFDIQKYGKPSIVARAIYNFDNCSEKSAVLLRFAICTVGTAHSRPTPPNTPLPCRSDLFAASFEATR